MSADKGCERKDTGDLKEGIRDSANISTEIAQDRFQNAITGTHSTMYMVDEHKKTS